MFSELTRTVKWTKFCFELGLMGGAYTH